MTETPTVIQQEVWRHFKDSQIVYLATAAGEQPRVRPVTLINFDQKFWVATGTRSVKVRQIRSNPSVEFCLPVSQKDKTGYIRVAGVADTVEDRETKARLADQMDYFSAHWKGVDDPNYTLLRITRVEVEYLRPGDEDVHTFLV